MSVNHIMYARFCVKSLNKPSLLLLICTIVPFVVVVQIRNKFRISLKVMEAASRYRF